MPDAGRGVFARVAFKKDDLIETCPVIPIPEHEVEALSHSILINYVYFFGKKKERIALALGFGSIYNHTTTPNAKYRENEKEQAISFIALRDIQKDEEITVNYVQGKQKNKKPLWFTTATFGKK